MANILLIEPNPVLAATYTKALLHAGYGVTHVTGGQAAVDAADAQAPDILIMELQLPAHNGVEFLHEFRSYGDWERIPVIVNTVLPPPALADIEPLLKHDLGVTAVCYKPRASLEDLVRLVREHIGS
ncbi:MAG TPA: response regulator [Bacillota bacterium]|nr:response regulator [Bacillota bacterium]